MRRFDLPAGPGAPREARRIVAGLDGVPRARLADAQLVASELVTNALRDSGLRPGERITMILGREDGRIRIEVQHAGGSRPRAPGAGGLALAAVAALSERWEADGGRVTSWI